MTQTDVIATVGELIERLSQLPADTRVLVNGYESGLSAIASTPLIEVRELSDMPEWAGRFVPSTDVEADISMHTTGLVRVEVPPAPVGDVFTAVVLQREGR